MKLYTRRGDEGNTDLFGGKRVRKDALRVQAYGAVDELNSVLGLAAAACEAPATGEIRNILLGLQSRLFEIGADLATPRKPAKAAPSAIPRIEQSHIDELEQHIDAISDQLPPMTHFILPGGSELAARLHVARTVCRRAERVCVSFENEESAYARVIVYLNRLSDLLFAMARQANRVAGVEDVPWVSPNRPS